MNTRLDPVAERRKLAHVLDVDSGRLAMLAELPPADVRELRAQLAEALFQADRHHFARIATLARTVPGAVLAKLTEGALPPLIAARTAELLEPHRAAELVGRLSLGYLADVAAAMDAGRAAAVVEAMPPQIVARVGTELARRGEWVVMGGFVAHVSEPALRAAVAELTGEQLLRISFVLEDLARLDSIGAMLTDAQRDGMLAGAAEHELWRELDDLVANLAAEHVRALADRVSATAVAGHLAAARAAGELSDATYEALTA
jgi:hypothetical protein